ncbi:hypothetical protein, partial [Pseudophaeobacter flagellatus]|uniref:hypothetical protein n=1 Tax=Pseudophaeobacter flagellatus TaxID=2899119 RepID=UPI001E348416
RTPSTGSGDAVWWVASAAGRAGETVETLGRDRGTYWQNEAGALDDLAHLSFVCLFVLLFDIDDN